ncbi:pescadillo homolog [Rosa rugosa]|uniref:pescadillo homolog n=1 Tax=Rosa rugosa TaxID=74645 RepID=UPI002B409938|nr:pescadillo homolog [Rosa rugosa]XP_062018380.1 pescadillo homolog [Rosa rugosa]XP_062018384.1 pescadillo homolog [Rosa rugosa]
MHPKLSEDEIKGKLITWLTPHPLQQVLIDDIDFNIMLNFLEFYEALLVFVKCHLYHSIDVPLLRSVGRPPNIISNQ